MFVDEHRRHEMKGRFRELAEYLNRQLHTGRLDEWEDLEMTIPQIKTLALLGEAGPLRMSNIADYLGRALSATTTVMDRLVEKGLVDRVSDPRDRRVVICRLTASGEQAIDGFWRIGQERLDRLADRLDDEQLETVVKAFETIRQAEDELKSMYASVPTSVEQSSPAG